MTASPFARGTAREYVVGVMTMEVEGKHSDHFHALVDQAAAAFDHLLATGSGLRVALLNFDGPHLTPTAGAYAPLDFLRIGLTEKLERGMDFLLVVTEVDLSASTLSYTLALPSQLTNIGILSCKRLDPAFWGDPADDARTARRLAQLLLHTFGHLLNLPHSAEPANTMYGFFGVDDLDAMAGLNAAQRASMRAALPREAHERTSDGSRPRFALAMLRADWRSIAHAVRRANPLRLAAELPTLITAALSVLIVLYRAFAFGTVLRRGRRLAESTVLTGAATLLCLAFTLLFLYLAFALLAYLGTVTIFPHKLMVTWPPVDPAVRPLDHVKLSLFVAALGILAGSLGGSADSRDLVRRVLFIDEET